MQSKPDMIKSLLIMSLERRKPQEGTKTAWIIGLLDEGKLHTEIVKETGLPSRQVTSLKNHIYRHGFLPRPSKEVKRENWRISHHPGHTLTYEHRQNISKALRGKPISAETKANLSSVKSTTWNQIEAYVNWGMYPSEISVAVFLEKGVELSLSRVHKALHHARKRGKTGYSMREESKKIRQEAQEPQARRTQRVAFWLNIATMFQENGLERMPEARSDWFLLFDYFNARRARNIGNRNSLAEFSQRLDTLTSEKLDQLQPFMRIIRDSDPISFQIDPKMLGRAMVEHGEVNL